MIFYDTPAYYAKLRELDGYVGRIVDAIKEAGIYENTAAQYKTANMAVLELFEFFWREFFLFHGESGQSSVPESARF